MIKKFLLLYFCLCIGASYCQNKSNTSKFIEKNIQQCRIQVNDTISFYNFSSNLLGNKISIIIKTENTITEKCTNKIIEKQILKKVEIKQNPLIEINDHFIEDLNITNYTNLIPYKLVAYKEMKNSIIILELYNFSYTNVGSGYIYECIKLDKNGIVIAKKKIEKKLPMRKKGYYKVF